MKQHLLMNSRPLNIVVWSFLAVFCIGIQLSFDTRSAAVTTVKGVIIDDQTSRPLKAVHAYIVSGEEEAFTNEKGEFIIETTQKLPLMLTIESHTLPASHEKQRVVVSSSNRLVIRLKGVK